MKPQVEIRYCTSWGYLAKAVSLADKMLSMHKDTLAGVNLVPSSGGAFEVSVNGTEIYSKLKTGQFPDEMQLVNKLLALK